MQVGEGELTEYRSGHGCNTQKMLKNCHPEKIKKLSFHKFKEICKNFFWTIITPKEPRNIILFYKNYYSTHLNPRFY